MELKHIEYTTEAKYNAGTKSGDTMYAVPVPKTPAGDIDSENAESGKVLTADGNGGASWQTAGGGGTGDYDDLDNKPIINANLNAITPVADTYYKHKGGAAATPFVVGQTYDKIYFDTSKSVEEMTEILSGLEYDHGSTYILVGYDTDDYPNGAVIFDIAEVGVAQSGYAIFTPDTTTCLFCTDEIEIEGSTTEIGWQNLNSDGSFNFNSCVAEAVNNVSFASATPFGGGQYKVGVIYYYDGTAFTPIKGSSVKRKTFGTYVATIVGTNVRITVTDADVTTNTLVNLYPQNVDTETFLQDNMTTSIINESDGSFNFTVKTDLPDTFAAYYTITEVI